MYGAVNDNDPSLAAKEGSNLGFGLNVGKFVKLGYEPNGGQGGSALDCFDVNIKVGEREFRDRFFDVTRVYSNNQELTDVNSPEYQKIKADNWKQISGTITHAVKSVGVTDAQIQQALSQPVATFADYCKIMTALLPQNFLEKEVHVFLEYQWNIPDGKDKAYLQLPKNMKGGRFLSPVLPGTWIEQREWSVVGDNGQPENVKGLRYVNEKQEVHPFVKTQDFMESNKGTQQIAGQQNTNTGISQQQVASTGSTW